MWRELAGYACDFIVALVIAALIWLTLSSCFGCTTAKQVSGEIGGTIAEFALCPTGLINCGEVRLFAAEADNELGHVELCVDSDDHPEDIASAEELFGPSEPTPRHQGLCIVTCEEESPLPGGKGANALSGSYCPERL